MINKLIDISIQAGLVIEKISKSRRFSVQVKADKTPVTEADLASHEVIDSLLSKNFPDIPILSEENCNVSYSTRKAWKDYFLVDPLDGTKEFIKNNGQYAVNIAYMQNDLPTAGLIHSPVTGDTWYAQNGGGAYKRLKDGTIEGLSVASPSDTVNVAISASYLSKITVKYIEDHFSKYKTHPIGSSLKFCHIAEGKVDIYPRLGPTSEWDTASAEVILSEAGGFISQYKNSRPLKYNKKDLLNPWFVAYGASLDQLKGK